RWPRRRVRLRPSAAGRSPPPAPGPARIPPDPAWWAATSSGHRRPARDHLGALQVRPLAHTRPPTAVLTVPRHRVTQPLREGETRLPAELLTRNREVDRVPPVVPGTVRHELDE